VILLDTHVLLWWRADGARLSRRALRAIEDADSIIISPVSFWEVGLLESKGRIRLDRDPFAWVRDLIEDERIGVAPLAPSAAMFAGRMPALGFPGDPADAMLYATARQEHMPLVTKDRRLRLFAAEGREVKTIW
jgi:PIN domain nuclease of toxin-antitoxin system